MKIVIDTNVFMAGLLKDSEVRRLLIDENINFFLPEYAINEVEKYKTELCNKSGYSEEDFESMISFLLENIEIVAFEQIKMYIEIAEKIMNSIDIKDAPFIATSLAIKADGIWSFDKDFTLQSKIKVFTTTDIQKLT
ncbi:MAG TPA: putative toxin-antitoxin system toxin component, PIN family [Candidatus Nanoarchaeia archaeon]|nr:putative toxin-antitoxin system toxin component, PIN family [Candidatus Nanoarchaeia archaeon]